MGHYDYVKLPDGSRRRISGMEDIQAVLDEWDEYINQNWLSPQQQMFDPESKVKYMLNGLANIILRPDMSGLLTEYQKMKIQKYEIPYSSCSSLMDDEVYGRRSKVDAGEAEAQLRELLDETARDYDEAKASRAGKHPYVPKKPPKASPPTRMKKIEAARAAHHIVSFTECRVDTENNFCFRDNWYHIPDECAAYAGHPTRDGEIAYDMDRILVGETADGGIVCFDMGINLVPDVQQFGEQIKFF